MKATDFHQRYYHPHYVLAVKLYLQADGTLLLISGNVRMEVTPDELHFIVCGLMDLSSVFKALHEQAGITPLTAVLKN
jgi:hypothetical protein